MSTNWNPPLPPRAPLRCGAHDTFRVVEMSSVFAAPSVGRVMADYGAEVIKV